MEVTRLKGATRFGTYVVSVFTDGGKVTEVKVSGKPHPEVTDICQFVERSKTRLVTDSVQAIKITMLRHLEYKGFVKQ